MLIRHIITFLYPFLLLRTTFVPYRCSHTTYTQERHPCVRRHSTPQIQQASGRRATPFIGRPVGLAAVSMFPVLFPNKSPPTLGPQATENSVWSMNVHCRVYDSPLLDTDHSQLNPVQTLIP